MIRALCVVALLALTGCSSGHPASAPPGGATSPSAPTHASSPSAVASPTGAARHAVASYAGWRLPYAIAREAVIVQDGGTVVLAGGMLPGDASSARAIELDPATGTARPLPSLGTPVHDTAGGLFDGLPAVFGGGNATEQSVVQVLHGRSWSQPAHLPTTRSDLSVVSVAGSTLVLGGYDGSAVPRAVLAVTSGGTLRQVGQLRLGVRYAATAVVSSDVYVFGGEVDNAELDAVQRYDTTTGRTSVVARLPHALGHAVAVSVGGRVLLLGGRTDANTQTAQMWWFDPASATFTRAGSLPRPTSDAAVVSVGGRILLLGGENPSVTDRVILVQVS